MWLCLAPPPATLELVALSVGSVVHLGLAPFPGLIQRGAWPAPALFFPLEVGSYQGTARPLVHHSATQCLFQGRLGCALLMFVRSCLLPHLPFSVAGGRAL